MYILYDTLMYYFIRYVLFHTLCIISHIMHYIKYLSFNTLNTYYLIDWMHIILYIVNTCTTTIIIML